MKIFLLFMLLFCFCCAPSCALAKTTPEPFAPIMEPGVKVTVAERFDLMVKLPTTDQKRLLFFGEARRNTGLSEEELTDAVKNGKVRVALVKECQLETAGVRDGKPEYWRKINHGEEVVFVETTNGLAPWFVLRCNNPARVVAEQKEQVTPAPQPLPTPTVAQNIGCCCPIPTHDVSATHQVLVGTDSVGTSIGQQLHYSGVFYPGNF